MHCPTIVIQKADPIEPQGRNVSRWLARYTRNLDDKMAVHFLCFCTSSDVLLLSRYIMISFQTMADEAFRLMAHTCFLTLTEGRNYHSYNQLKNNFDFYLRDTSLYPIETMRKIFFFLKLKSGDMLHETTLKTLELARERSFPYETLL